jgi:hypothetical protein
VLSVIYLNSLVDSCCQYTMETIEVKNTGTKLGLRLSLRDLRLSDDNPKRTRKHKSSYSGHSLQMRLDICSMYLVKLELDY